MKKSREIFWIVLLAVMCWLPGKLSAEAAEPTFATKETAAVYLREQMVLREKIISFSIDTNYYEEIFKEILLLAVDQERAEFGHEGDYLRYHYRGFDGVATKQEEAGRYLLTYTMLYYTTYEQEELVSKRVAQVLELPGIQGTGGYERIRAIYQYVCEMVAYDTQEIEGDYGRFTAYNALFEGKAVCQGYATLLQRLLCESGILSRVVTGKAGNEEHAWNIVELDGVWYNLDASWDTNYELGSYRYFLKNMKEFAGHTRSAEFLSAQFCARYPMAEESHHNWGVPEVVQEATCTEQGIEIACCTDCTENMQNKLALAEHHWQEETENATCTKTGKKYQKCSVCQKISGEVILEKEAHTHGKWLVKKSATCTDAGLRVRYCAVCGGNEETEDIEPTSHMWKSSTRKATIFQAGYVKRTCEVCLKQETQELEKLPSYVWLNTGNVRMQAGTSTTAVKVTEMAAGDMVKRWTSSNKKVATVNRLTGKIRAKAVGKAVIKVVTKSGAESSFRLTVQKKVVKTKNIVFSEAVIGLKKGASVKLKVQRIPVTANDRLTFVSSKPRVAKVTKKGVVTGLKKGTSVVIVKTVSGKKAKCRVRVS